MSETSLIERNGQLEAVPSVPPITIENIGPIEGVFSIDLSSGPGCYILRGSKGRGKSTTLSVIELLAGHKVDVTLHDGALDGRITGFGTSIPVTRTRLGKRVGTFSADALDAEKYTISDITDPPIKDPVKADAHRIRALASLAKTHVEPEDFIPLVGAAEFWKAVHADDLRTDDPVLIASRIKQAFDAQARSSEQLADRCDGQAHACQTSLQGLDLDTPCDAVVLQQTVDQAVSEQSRLKTLHEAAQKSQQVRDAAEERLGQAQSDYTGPSIERAEAMVTAADRDVSNFTRAVEELKEKLRATETERDKARARLENSRQALRAAQDFDRLKTETQKILNAGLSKGPDPAEILAAQEKLSQARVAQEQGVRIRDAKRRFEEGNKHLEEAGQHRARAAMLREAAMKTFDVLMRSVKLEGIRIKNVHEQPRLVINHPLRGETLYAECSDGERVRAMIDVLMPMIGVPGVFPISQRLFQDMSPLDHAELDTYAKAKGIYVLGALIDDGQLRVTKL